MVTAELSMLIQSFRRMLIKWIRYGGEGEGFSRMIRWTKTIYRSRELR